MKDITDIMEQLDLRDKKTEDGSEKKPNTFAAEMKRFNTLLRTGKSALRKDAHLRRAQRHALLYQKAHTAATDILSQPRDDDVDVFPFLALPAELRLPIYHELLVSDDRLFLTWRGPRRHCKQQKKIYIDILLTCKLAQTEGVDVLYGENIFDFEEIRRRPSFAKGFLQSIGPINPTFIRIIVADYAAASEDLAQGSSAQFSSHALTCDYISSFLGSYNISLNQLRLFAISIIPYGADGAYLQLMKDAAPGLVANKEWRTKWLAEKNERLGSVVEAICKREKNLKKVEYAGIDKKLSFEWLSPYMHRHWVVYQEQERK
ncbi:hypothetical protein K469DRAFT_747642 [Zopfia rhizophila CBS 207.26]|uniref:Uncharacterized protein n=1 Tax=Zopfia rhizophila CBS 207.26 TaxID=1314779 RepID=A0A6A6EHK1_9PEZI|nr:hypothetical protein K469DRAFT_747642 [Zopfia rhizophila CBS 207.26]